MQKDVKSQLRELREELEEMNEYLEGASEEAEYWKKRAASMEEEIANLNEAVHGLLLHVNEHDDDDDPPVDERYDTLKCIVCDVHLANMVYVPCKHMCVCRQCSRNINNCPICGIAKEIHIRMHHR